MNKALMIVHWRILAVGALAIGCFAAIQGGDDGRRCAEPMQRAQAALRDLPSRMDFQATSPVSLSDIDLPPAGGGAACAAQSKATDREGRRALRKTLTPTTAVIVNRNASHVVQLAQARWGEP